MTHLTDRERKIILNVDEWMSLAFEREKAGVEWRVDLDGNTQKNRSKLVAGLTGISKSTLDKMRANPERAEPVNHYLLLYLYYYYYLLLLSFYISFIKPSKLIPKKFHRVTILKECYCSIVFEKKTV